jgi:hypothetical protein
MGSTKKASTKKSAAIKATPPKKNVQPARQPKDRGNVGGAPLLSRVANIFLKYLS